MAAVVGGGHAVQLPKGFQETAVVAEAVFGAGRQNPLAVGNVLAAALHPQLGEIVVDALHGVFLEDAGQVLPADVGVLGQLGDGQVGVPEMLLDVVGHRCHQGVGGGGFAQAVLPDDLADDHGQLAQEEPVHLFPLGLVRDGEGGSGLLDEGPHLPLVAGVLVENQKPVGNGAACRPQAAGLQRLLPKGVVDLDDEPVVGVVVAGMHHLGGNQHQLPGVQLVLAAADVIAGLAADHINVLVVGVVVGH